jgi:hypothetical protein
VLVFAGTTSRGRNTWFVRNDPFPAINPSPAFHEEIALVDGEALALEHRMVIADRIRTREEIEALAAEYALWHKRGGRGRGNAHSCRAVAG